MWNLSDLLGVVRPPIGALEPLRDLVPKAVLSALLLSGGIFAFLESVYLAAQSAQFGSVRIIRWLRVFRVIAVVLMVSATMLMGSSVIPALFF
jgi:hypothetical protein